MLISEVTLKQNDIPAMYNSADGKNEHCFSFSLYVCAALSAGKVPSIEDYLECYIYANKKGILIDETKKQSHGAFVVSDRQWPQLILDYYKSTKKWVRVTENASWIILNGRTRNGGHFRELNYDPWYEEVRFLYIKSIKLYRVV